MKVVTVPKILLNPITLPGMGRSIEVADVPQSEANQIRMAFAAQQLYVQFEEEQGVTYPVINLWPDPHDASRMTLFIK
ncbi:hypothetical protein LLE49_01250 [Alicyclobacillus tolerans]|uniref:hypothetical protein n=1 Tax=Alicyclobacillus tolerans TaxID=90970 RepID=UPI001F284856|nr:hypothetical protein [Alicyclobacillus tolerans]MCF8563370.1 hypothetical protein [Alicyclobacillus tolerans]